MTTTIYARVIQNQRATYKDITIDQGSTFSDNVTLKNIDNTAFDLTNYSVRGSMRRSLGSEDAINFTCTVTNASAGEFTMSLTSSQTNEIVTQNYMTTVYSYDVEIYTNNEIPIVYRVLRGRAFVEPQVTR